MYNITDENNLIPAIKKMDAKELSLFAVQLREELINNVSKTGGHLASNLGIVELTLALHKVFDSPRDKIVWDVGHQTYIHKMITGRRAKMDTIRQFGGLSGFPKREESIHDTFDSGHSSTSISAALGYAKARDLDGEDYSCIAVIGDGALTGGEAYEALNCAGASKTPFIVVLNDNVMSISENKGGIAKHLQKLRMSDSYIGFKNNLKKTISKSPKTEESLKSIRNAIKYALVPGVIFEELGFKYFGPIDGHNMQDLIDAMEGAKALKRPVLLHVVTKKGKGFTSAEKNPEKYHGIGKFDPSTATPVSSFNAASWSGVFGTKLTEMAGKDDKIVAITAAMADGTGLSEYREKYPSRFFDTCIAEQHAVSFSAGLALGGYKPFTAIYSTFLQRAYDQVIEDVCLQNLPVTFAIDRAGVTGADGETHQGIFDIAFLSAAPNLTLLSPRCSSELCEMMEYAAGLGTPCAIRYPRGNAAVDNDYPGFVPAPEFIRNGKDLLIITDGCMFDDALKACNVLLSKGIDCGLCNLRVLKPLSTNVFSELFTEYSHILTIEDGVVSGGFGQRISAMAAIRKGNSEVLNLGWPDKFIEHGSVEQLREKYGLDAASIAERAEAFIEKKA